MNYWNETKDKGKIIELVNVLHSRVKADQKCLNSRKTELSASFPCEFLEKKKVIIIMKTKYMIPQQFYH